MLKRKNTKYREMGGRMGKISTKELEREYLRKFPSHGKQVFNGLLRLVDNRVWGTYQNGSGKHVNSHKMLTKNWARSLPKYKLYEHLIHNDNPLHIHYTSRGLILDGRRYLMLCIDVDNKKGLENDSRLLANDIQDLLGIQGWMCNSTHGNGTHLFVMIDFDAKDTIEDVNASIKSLSDNLKIATKQFAYNSNFDRICGTMSDVPNLKLGTLVKLPNPTDDADMSRLWSVMGTSTSIDDLLARLGVEDTLRVTPSLRSVSSCDDILYSNNKKLGAISKSKNVKTLDEIKNITDTLERRREYAFHLKRAMGRIPTIDEVMNGYLTDVDAGEVSRTRRSNFLEILDYMHLKHNPDKGGWNDALVRAKTVIETNNISQITCDEAYGKQKNRTILTPDDVAVVLALAMTYTNGRTTNVTMTGAYVFAMTKRYKAEGKISKTIDYKKYRACKQIMLNHNLIAKVGEHKHGVHATQYVVVDALDRAPDAIRAVPSHSKASEVSEVGASISEAANSIKENTNAKYSDLQHQTKQSDCVCGTDQDVIAATNGLSPARCCQRLPKSYTSSNEGKSQ